MAGDAAVFHTPVNDIGTEFLESELGRLLGYVFFHKDGEFGGGEGHGRDGVYDGVAVRVLAKGTPRRKSKKDSFNVMRKKCHHELTSNSAIHLTILHLIRIMLLYQTNNILTDFFIVIIRHGWLL